METIIGDYSYLPIPYKKGDLKEIDINNYEIISELGEGSYGIVYKGKNKNTNNIVAVKLIDVKKISKPNKIINELNIMKKLSFNKSSCNNYIICLYDYGKTNYNNIPYYVIVMQYLSNSDELLQYANNAWGFKIPPKNMFYLLIQLILGLHYIHSNNIYHLDIKLENILVHSRQNLKENEKWYKYPNIKYIDFGLSCIKNDRTCYNIKGTHIYFSPEIANYINNKIYNKLTNKDLESSDIYSLGVILYELLEQHPYTLNIYNCEYPIDTAKYISKKDRKKLIYPSSFSETINPEKYMEDLNLSDILEDIISSLTIIDPDKRIKNFDTITKYINDLNINIDNPYDINYNNLIDIYNKKYKQLLYI
jgi:serine/threonine protein kinase